MTVSEINSGCVREIDSGYVGDSSCVKEVDSGCVRETESGCVRETDSSCVRETAAVSERCLTTGVDWNEKWAMAMHCLSDKCYPHKSHVASFVDTNQHEQYSLFFPSFLLQGTHMHSIMKIRLTCSFLLSL